MAKENEGKLERVKNEQQSVLDELEYEIKDIKYKKEQIRKDLKIQK